MLRKIIPYVPAIAWWLLSLYLFLLPGSAFPKAGWMQQWQVDKWVHALLFGVLVYLFYRPVLQKNSVGSSAQYAWTVLLLAMLYGIVIELVQHFFVPNRSMDVGDIAADLVGACCPFLLYRKRLAGPAA
jgi:hypothetical protein